MRGGVLADSAPAQQISYPLDFLTNERHFGMPHLESLPRARKAKRPFRATRKPRAAILAHHELSQMMSPMNPTVHMDAFAKQAAMAASPQPTKTYQGHVDSFFDEFCKLFNARMHAFQEDGTHIHSVWDGEDRHPLIYTNAQNHMYWHCSKEAIKSLSSCARTVMKEGGKSYKPQLEQSRSKSDDFGLMVLTMEAKEWAWLHLRTVQEVSRLNRHDAIVLRIGGHVFHRVSQIVVIAIW